MAEQILAVEGGGDWNDASVEYYVLLKTVDLNALYELYNKLGGYHGHDKKWFCEVLKEQGVIRDLRDSDPLVTFFEE